MIRLSLALALLGCAGTGTGEPPFAPGLAGDSGAPPGGTAPVVAQRAWLAVDAVTFLPGQGCAPGDSGVAVRTAPGLIELVGTRRLATRPTLEAGAYCGLTLQRGRWDGAEPAALTGATFVLEGVADGVPLRVRSAATGPLTLLAPSGSFEMAPGAGPVLLFLDVARLFDGFDPGGAARAPDGAIELSPAVDPDGLAELEAALPGALFLYRDWDGDGELDADERAEGRLAAGAP